MLYSKPNSAVQVGFDNEFKRNAIKPLNSLARIAKNSNKNNVIEINHINANIMALSVL
jgi:hypothetical protein